MKIGAKIKERRLSLGLKQKDVAGDRITRSMLCEIESGTAMPSISTLVYLAEKLGGNCQFTVHDEYFITRVII